jgi:hypothetical protein
MWLLDTCSIINLSYCSPIAATFKNKYQGKAGWALAVRQELTAQRSRIPANPQAGRASNWAVSWLGEPILVADESRIVNIEAIQRRIKRNGGTSALEHLGEAASIDILLNAGQGRLISDDHAARSEARRVGVRASSTIGILAKLLALPNSPVSAQDVDTYLDLLRQYGRLRTPLTSSDLLASNLGAWV